MFILVIIGLLHALSYKESEAVKCFVCNNPTGDCNSATNCEGTWCIMQIVKNPNDGKFITSKQCSQTNSIPSGKEDCFKIESQSQDGTVSITCACNGQDFCNTQDYLKKFPVVQNLDSTGGLTGSGNSGSGLAASGSGSGLSGFNNGFGQAPVNTGGSGPFAPFFTPGNNNLGGNTNQPFGNFGIPSSGQNQSGFATQVNQAPNFGFGGQGQGLQTGTGTVGLGISTNGVSCYQCVAQSLDCNNNQCQGATWCQTHIMRNDQQGVAAIQKDCVPQHPLGGETKDKCAIGTSGAGTAIVCGCNSQNLCNSKSYLDQLIQLAQTQQASQGSGTSGSGFSNQSNGGLQGSSGTGFGTGQSPTSQLPNSNSAIQDSSQPGSRTGSQKVVGQTPAPGSRDKGTTPSAGGSSGTIISNSFIVITCLVIIAKLRQY